MCFYNAKASNEPGSQCESVFFSYNPGEASGMIFVTVCHATWNSRSKGWSKERAFIISEEFTDGLETLIDIVRKRWSHFLAVTGPLKERKHQLSREGAGWGRNINGLRNASFASDNRKLCEGFNCDECFCVDHADIWVRDVLRFPRNVPPPPTS